MNLKKIHGKTIDDARSKARALYGDDVVVLETFDAIDGEMPGITVLVDKPSRETVADDGGGGGSFRNVFYKRSDIGRLRTTAVFPSDGPAQAPADGGLRAPASSGSARSSGSAGSADSARSSGSAGGGTRFIPLDRQKETSTEYEGRQNPDGGASRDTTGTKFVPFDRTAATDPGGMKSRFGSGAEEEISGRTTQGRSGSGVKAGNSGTGRGSFNSPDAFFGDDMPPPAEPRSLEKPTVIPRSDDSRGIDKPDPSRRMESLRRYASMQMASSGRFSTPMAPPSDYLMDYNATTGYGSAGAVSGGPYGSAGSDDAGVGATTGTSTSQISGSHDAATPSDAPDESRSTGRFRFTGAPQHQKTSEKKDARNSPAPEATAALNLAREDQTRREIIALHKRFEKLEALLDANLATADLDLVAHPSFQQLVKAGVRPAVINRWFRQITGEGIDPEEQPEQFMNELSVIIRTALNRKPAGSPGRVQLFAGASGAGKTHMIMKLAARSSRDGHQTAVVSVEPDLADDQYYYSILELFCKDHQIAFYRVNADAAYESMAAELDTFDAVLIDTPPLSMRSDKAYRALYKQRKRWPAEIHYIANAGHGPHALEMVSRAHHTLQPDVVCITHMDEIDQWGPLIPFLSEMGSSCRWLGTGPSLYNGLTAYSPAFVAQKILQDS
jgi:flagellar biosynthesis GTPase FlhF